MGLLVAGDSQSAYKSVDRTSIAATAGQTTFTVSQGYTVGDIDVFLNGIKLLEGDDYYASNGTTVLLNSAAALGDILTVMSYNPFLAANTYTKTEADTRYMVANGVNAMTSYLRTPNYGVSSWSESATASLEASVGAGEQGVGVKAFGRSVATNGGDILYTADSRGAGGRHRFGYWNGTSFTSTMNLDSSGRLTLPNQPAFYATDGYSGSDFGTTENTVVYSTCTGINNRGSCYNTSTGIFTAPVAGYYQFNYSILNYPNTSSVSAFYISVNNSASYHPLVRRWGAPAQTTFEGASCFYLAAGDNVRVRATMWVYTSGGHGHFSGFLIG